MSWKSRRESLDTGRSRSIWNSGLDTVGTQGSSHRATKPTAKCMDHTRGGGGTLVVGLALGLSRGGESLAEIGIRSPRDGATPQRINLACLVVLTHPKHLCTELSVLQLTNTGAQQTHRRMTGKELPNRSLACVQAQDGQQLTNTGA